MGIKFRNKKKKTDFIAPVNIDSRIISNSIILQGKILSELYKQRTSKNIQDYEFKVYSQNGEDGIIQYLINNIEIKNKVFVEFGVENYTEANTRFLLINNNWSGLIIDGSQTNMEQVRNSDLVWRYDLKAIDSFITKDNINELISSNGISGEIGILSVDIDGNDYWVYDAITVVNPQILIMEYNSLFGKNVKITTPYDADFVRGQKHYSNLYYGASISALADIANKRGYDLVGSNSFGNNLFFVRKDCNSLGISLTPQEAYVQSKFKESRDEKGALSFLTHKDGLSLIAEEEVYNIDTNTVVKIKDVLI